MSTEFEMAADPAIGNVQRQMRRMMDQMQKSFFNFCPSETWTPNVNLYESDTAYLVCVDLAGVEKDKIEVEVTNQKLTLRGSRPVPLLPGQEGEDGTEGHAGHGGHGGQGAQGAQGGPRYRVHVMEIDHGPFCREVDLPEDVAHEHVSAAHRNGLLWIELPKTGARPAGD